jgi:prepilin-type N-terminal cleavage/methylation domain-containing protein
MKLRSPFSGNRLSNPVVSAPPGRQRRLAMKRCKGFTLFEMVVAVSIFALMGVIAFGGLGQMTRNGQSVADANSRLRGGLFHARLDAGIAARHPRPVR